METRAFRLTVRFLLSTVPAPCGVQKPTGPLSSKTLPPLSSFYSGCVMCNGVACGSLLVEALHPPRPRQEGSITDLLTAWDRILPRRPGEDTWLR